MDEERLRLGRERVVSPGDFMFFNLNTERSSRLQCIKSLNL